MPAPSKKVYIEETEEELLKMSRTKATRGLNERQIKFCEIYVKNYNIKLAAIQAGYSERSAHCAGWKIRQDPNCNRYLAWLKVRISNKFHLDAVDVIDQYARIAFADITDFVDISKGKIKIKDGIYLDGQIIKSIKEGRDGITIEMNDKMQALAKLERFFDVMPKDWRQKIEERKVELMEQKLELEKLRAGQGSDIVEDDGFLEALRGTAAEVWDEEDEGGDI